MLVSVASITRPSDPKNVTELNFENSDELFGKWKNSGFQVVDGSDGAHYIEPTDKDATLTYDLDFQAREVERAILILSYTQEGRDKTRVLLQLSEHAALFPDIPNQGGRIY